MVVFGKPLGIIVMRLVVGIMMIKLIVLLVVTVHGKILVGATRLVAGII